VSREASPFSRGEIESRLLRRASHGVFDFDDALFHDGSLVRRALGQAQKCQRCVEAADVVIAGNAYLAEWASRYAADVRMIPSCIEPSHYVPKTDWNIPGPVPVIAWLGSPATEFYVSEIAPALLEVHRRTGARLLVISGPVGNPALRPLDAMTTRIRWNKSTFAAALHTADVAIAPLDDLPYSRGKCAYKLLQYAATALPIVGTPVGANSLALTRFGGLQVNSQNEWVDALLQLLSSHRQRQEAGTDGLSAVSAHYSFSAWEGEWRQSMGI
jgi:glycosyltransferase involved in cell wall biosynthesis